MGKRTIAFVGISGFFALLLILTVRSTLHHLVAPPAGATAMTAPTLTDLHAMDELKTRFNQDTGAPRLILLVSPT